MCVRACVRVCVRACVGACVCGILNIYVYMFLCCNSVRQMAPHPSFNMIAVHANKGQGRFGLPT